MSHHNHLLSGEPRQKLSTGLARRSSYSLSSEPRTGVITELETQEGAAATYKLKNEKTVFISKIEI